jgi:hypothetical protein
MNLWGMPPFGTASLSQVVIAGIIDPLEEMQNQGHPDDLMALMGGSTCLR